MGDRRWVARVRVLGRLLADDAARLAIAFEGTAVGRRTVHPVAVGTLAS